MASPGQLVEAVSDVLGVPQATVSQFDRTLALEGLRTRGGRGSSAARVTAVDAANLLIAIAASPLSGPSIKSAVQTCRAYSELIAVNIRGRPTTFPGEALLVLELAELPAGHTFRDALASIIDCARAGVFDRGAKVSGGRFSLFVQVQGPIPDAYIGISTRGANESVKYRPANEANVKPQLAWRGDLFQRRGFSKFAVNHLAALLGPLKGDELHDLLRARFAQAGQTPQTRPRRRK